MRTKKFAYRLYWKDGKTEVVEGDSVTNAFVNAGYGNGAVAALDFFKLGKEQTYNWDKTNRTWIRDIPLN